MTARPRTDVTPDPPPVRGTGRSDRDPPRAEIVIATLGRPSLAELLGALATQEPRWSGPVTIVDDRPRADRPLPGVPGADLDLVIVRADARGPAAARNLGLAAARAPWVVFLDDDVLPEPGWVAALHADLAASRPSTGAVQGRIVVPATRPRARVAAAHVRTSEPLPVAGADLAVRRDALTRVGGFDERLPHAHRDDADVALRLRRAGAGVVPGIRTVRHPGREDAAWSWLTDQRRHRDDARMRWEHGRHWRREATVGRGRIRRHLLATASGLVAATGAATGHRRAAALGGALWIALTADLTRARIAPGRTPARSVALAAVTSAAIPPAAVYQRVRGELAVRRLPDPATDHRAALR